MQAAQYTGPLPTPQMLGDYNSVLPGLAERVVMQRGSRRPGTSSRPPVRNAAILTGQFAAFVIAMTGLIVGALLIRDGHDIAGLTTLLQDSGRFVGAFLYRQIKGANET